jgi:hypothetical protein
MKINILKNQKKFAPKQTIREKQVLPIPYTEENLKTVLNLISVNLTVDLLPKYMIDRNINGGSNGKYGHCHTSSGALYKIFGPQNMKLFRNKDDEGLYHWWVVDNMGKIIDPTAEQYTLLNRTPPYEGGVKKSILGFEYRKRVNILVDRVISGMGDIPHT